MATLASQQLAEAESLTLKNSVTGYFLTIATTGGTVQLESYNGSDTNPVVEGQITNETVELRNPAMRELKITSIAGASFVTVSSWSVK